MRESTVVSILAGTRLLKLEARMQELEAQGLSVDQITEWFKSDKPEDEIPELLQTGS